MNIKTANRLCDLRKKHGLSQEELAEKLGVSRQAISKWERSESSPDTDNLIELSKIYGISLDELLNGDEETLDEIKENKESNKDFIAEDDDGSKVHIGKDGIFVKDGKDEVHISNEGIHVNEKHYTYQELKEKKRREFIEGKIAGLTALVVLVAYLVVGCLLPHGKGWVNYWFMFIAIPVPGSIYMMFAKHDLSKFNYPCTVTAIYCALGMFLHLWHPMWVLFITIPVFYTFASIFKKNKDDDDDEDDEDDDED